MKKFLLLILLGIVSFSFLSCKGRGDDDEGMYILSSNKVSLKAGQTHQFYVEKNGVKLSATDFRWKSSDWKRGYIDKNGLLTANVIGEFKISASKDGTTVKANVTVTPRETFFVEPTEFLGRSKEYVKNNAAGTIVSEPTDSYLNYRIDDKYVRYMTYFFDENNNVKHIITVFSTVPTAKRIVSFYLERYIPIDDEEGPENLYWFQSVDNSIIVVGIGYHDKIHSNIAHYYIGKK